MCVCVRVYPPVIKRGKGKSPKIGGPNGKTIRQKGDCPIAKKLM
jgi:hypothetical protein